ncbi:DNA-directed RNA polymerase [Apis cerana cerana]|uniref:DNA-directed RNA polymerase n=1 Tax=Apis cerana cerana TaxID=94128 RepID=A0A2A3E160_APICC|nr:DNA-directed RNA polymerase [Apis cerana cerana]
MSKFLKHYQVHTYATTANVLDNLPKKKKIKERTKNYAELLAVTNKTASNKRTEIQKLTARDLSMFVNNINTINNSYNDKDSIFNHAFNLKLTEDYHNFYDNEIYMNFENNKDIVIDNENEIKNFYNEKKNNSNVCDKTKNNFNKKKLTKSKEINNLNINALHKTANNKYKIENYVENLMVHIQIYLNCGLLNKANNLLKKYRKKYIQNCDKNIELYNMFLEAYASRRKITKVLELYNMIKEDSLTPTPQTYVYIFDVLGKESASNHIELLKKLNNEMDNYNISFNDIINKSYFKNDQQENVLKAINILMPNFKPSFINIDTTYNCNFLNQIPMSNNYESPVKELLTNKELKNLLKKQFQNELAIEVQIPSIKINEKNINTDIKEKIMEIENQWKKVAFIAFEKNLKCLKEKECQQRNLMVLYPFLEVLDKEHYINAILREIRHLAIGSDTYSTSLKLLYVTVGKYIYRKYEIETKKKTGVLDKIINIYLQYLKWYLYPENKAYLNNMNNRTVWQYFKYKEIKYDESLNTICLQWPIDVIINIGQDIKHSIPAFYTLFRNKGNYLSEQIKPHPFLSKLYKKSCIETLTFDVHLLPSYCPPLPWTSIHSGGYLITKTNFIRSPNIDYQFQNIKSKQLFPVFDSLNQVSSIPWKINTAILDIVIKIFQDGGSVELNVPQSVSVLSPPCSLNKNATIEEKQKVAIAIAQYRQKKNDTYSLWCDTLYKLSIANHFRNEIFWLPYNLDFRGRVYPIPPYLNHLSSDLGRSLLLFAKGKPLGPNGINWLKLHVINLTNFKKGSSLKERLEYANQNIDNIIDSAANPLTGKMWWKQSEEPWQTLAGCIEIANALKSPDIEKYITSFPVHQDGSCNGLQHYAALGKDQIGAESVNLYPFDVPKDIYSEVVSIIENRRQIDAKNNVKVAQLLEGFIKRKIIKQTVMTTVYGVTKYGAKHQIARQLRDTPNFPQEYIWPASIYLTECTFHSLRKMFKSAREIQDWFTECARIISSICCENVEWITPLGLPIVQPYLKQKLNTYVKKNEKSDTIKQRNAFAPNFIHSLDSTHMMLTSLHCNSKNITFVSVHDCFWTHPCSVDTMNKICREQFVALHSNPILEDLSKFFIKRYLPIYKELKYKNDDVKKIHKCLTNIPSKGTFDIHNVLSSTYFFN